MISRRLLIVLVYALPILVVAFGVVMGAATVAGAVQDAAAAQVLRWVALSCLLLVTINVILLVGVLGINALDDQSRRESERGRPPDYAGDQRD